MDTVNYTITLTIQSCKQFAGLIVVKFTLSRAIKIGSVLSILEVICRKSGWDGGQHEVGRMRRLTAAVSAVSAVSAVAAVAAVAAVVGKSS